jgi:hypothetical protein
MNPIALATDTSSLRQSAARSPGSARSSTLLCLFAAAALAAGCGGGGGGGSSPAPAPPPVGPQITVSGTATYQSVPANNGGALNYAATTSKPIRGATVELLNGVNGPVLGTTSTNASGAYSFPAVSTPSGPVVVRVRAELRDANADVTVKDNTSSDALYVLDSAPVTPTTAAPAINLSANSGWGSTSYTQPRSAAPFAVLDVIYQGIQKVRSAAPGQVLPPLQIFWSTRNTNSGGTTNAELAAGQIGTSFFSLGSTSGFRIYLLGDAATDADEYDSPVVAHEWGHYLQSAVSTDHSVGGPHTGSDRLDMRVAFSEGFGNAFAGMVLNNPRYTDSATGPSGQLLGFVIDVSANPATNRGWYSESSAQYLMWTWSQNSAIGFNGIYSTLTGPLRSSGALLGLHHFAQRLKDAVPGAASTINTNLSGQSIVVQDVWGTGETNNGGVAEALPLYTTLVGNTARLCLSDAVGTPNKLRNHAYLRFSTTAARNTTITVRPEAGVTGTDPDMRLVTASGSEQFGLQAVADLETLQVNLPAGDHSLAIEDFNLTADTVQQGQRCFNVTLS